ncbi:MAG: TIGR03118 family protein [Alphaproteobacteria bacterium]|nr:TIGR03118 family protein [Alphaproteobacteria bacterium]MBP7761574.1 TIGR03118 family protein [Alphaproteobacteria bacterium]
MMYRKMTLLSCVAITLFSPSQAKAEGYILQNLVANRQIYMPEIVDPQMVNAWGLAIRPAGAGGHFWINNTDTGTVSLYVGDVGGKKLFQDDVKRITLPAADPKAEHSTPTGQVFNGVETEFVVTHDGITGPSKFIFCTEDGTIIGWTEKKNDDGTFIRPSHGVIAVDQSKQGAIYKGITVSVNREGGNRLYAVDFANNRVDIFDSSFKPLKIEGAFAHPAGVPSDHAPFNVQELGGILYITYARLTKEPGEEEQGTGLGYLAAFDYEGKLIREFEGRKDLDAPWGLAIATADFGQASGRLLVGNFGNGKIVTFDLESGKQAGVLKRPDGNPLEVEGLWGILFGNGQSLGDANALYYAAGPAEEADGVFGKIVWTP